MESLFNILKFDANDAINLQFYKSNSPNKCIINPLNHEKKSLVSIINARKKQCEHVIVNRSTIITRGKKEELTIFGNINHR